MPVIQKFITKFSVALGVLTAALLYFYRTNLSKQLSQKFSFLYLISLNNGSYFDEILSRLENIGKYDIQWKVMNSKDYGIPQSRDRLYIIGILSSSQGQDFVFPPKK